MNRGRSLSTPALGLLIAGFCPLHNEASGQDRSRSPDQSADRAVAERGQAEPSRPAGRLSMQPDFLRRDLRMFSETLGLAEDQHFILEAIYDDYEAAFTEAARNVSGTNQASRDGGEANPEAMAEYRRRSREIRQEVQRGGVGGVGGGIGATGNPAAQGDEIDRRLAELRAELGLDKQERSNDGRGEAYAQAVRQWQLERDRLTAEFTERVKSILNPEQMGRWPALERRLTRMRVLDQGVLSGERVDLVAIVGGLELDAATLAALGPLMEQYEVELHDALVAREAVRAAQSGSPDDDRAAGRLMERSVTVRSVNDLYSQRIGAGVAQDVRVRFQEQVHEQGFPRIFRDTPTEALFHDALRLSSLTVEQRKEVLEMQTSYLGELSAMNESLIDLLRQSEPQDLLRGRGPRDPNSSFALRIQDRDALDGRYAQLLRDLLGPELSGRIAGRGTRGDAERAAREAEGRQAVGVSGGQGRDRAAKGRSEGAREALMRRFDLDHDGVLSAEERQKAAEAARQGDGPEKDGKGEGGEKDSKGGGGR